MSSLCRAVRNPYVINRFRENLQQIPDLTLARAGNLSTVGQGQRIPSELEVELARTRKELAETKMERDLLKKFATYFAKESR